MRTRSHIVLGLFGVMTAGLFCMGLQAQAPPPDIQAAPAKKCKDKDTRCKDAPSAPAATDPQPAKSTFAFPVEQSQHGGDAEGTPAQPTNPNGLPGLPRDTAPDPPASSNRPVKLPADGIGTGAPEASSSSSSSSGSNDAPDDADDMAPPPDAPTKVSRRAPVVDVRAKLDATRVPDDVKVGRYYLSIGNLQGAYLRFQDAVEHGPEDPESHFYLAEAAAKLNKRAEAVSQYQSYLKLDEGGDHDKDARKALTKLGAAAR